MAITNPNNIPKIEIKDNPMDITPEETTIETPEVIENNNVEAWVFTIPWINDQVTRQIEEPVVEEPIIEEPVVTEAPVIPEVKEEPVKVEEIKTPEVKPTAEKVLTAEEIKANQLAIKTQEDQIKAAENEKATASFNAALETGNLEDVAKISAANPELRDDFNAMVKANLKNKAWIDFFKQYNGMSNEEMMTAVNDWKLVTTSDQYKTLPPEQRAAFEQYKKEYDASQSWNKDYDKDNFTKQNTVNIVTAPTYTWLDLRKKSEELMNNPELTTSSAKLSDLQWEVNDYNDEIDKIEDQVKEQYPNLPSSAQAAIIADRQKSLLRAKNTKLNEYNTELGHYTRLKDNVTQELEFLQYEDSQNKYAYEIKLNQYNENRKLMSDAAVAEFTEQNKAAAADLKFQRELQAIEFEANLKEEQKGGIYDTDRQWREVYIKDWVSSYVRNEEGDILFTEDKSEQGYKDTITKENGVIVTTRNYTDWRSPEYFTYDINGNSSTNSNNVVNDLVSNIKWEWQCGAAVNRYVTGQLWISSEDFWMWDSYESKSKYIQEWAEPMVWWIAIWNSQWAENWHTWIVTGYDIEKWTVQITDWNWNTDPNTWKGDEKKFTHDVKISDIYWSDWGFYNPDSIPKAAWYESQDVPLYKKFLEWKLTSTDQKGIKDFETFKVQAEIYQDELTEQWTPQIEKVIELAKNLRDNAPWRKGRIIAWTAWGQFLSADYADYKAEFEAFISNQALANLVQLKQNGATFGALSDKELQFIQSSATNLRDNQSDEAFKKELDRIIETLQKGLSEEKIAELNWWDIVEEEIVPKTNKGSLYNTTKQTIDTSDFNSIIGK